MKILVWSENPVKIKSVKEALKKCVYISSDIIDVWGVRVESDVSDMPKNIDEVMLWARNRAHNLKLCGKEADYYIGIEWWAVMIWNNGYLFWVTHILHQSWEEHAWFSSFIEIPEIFRKWVFEDNIELGPLVDTVSNIEDTGKKTGSYGLWSDNMITRQSQFESSFISAISPFYNKYYKL